MYTSRVEHGANDVYIVLNPDLFSHARDSAKVESIFLSWSIDLDRYVTIAHDGYVLLF
jgi:hypothetical protein